MLLLVVRVVAVAIVGGVEFWFDIGICSLLLLLLLPHVCLQQRLAFDGVGGLKRVLVREFLYGFKKKFLL